MEMMGKEYVAPAVRVRELDIERCVCQSAGGVEGTRNGYGDALEEVWS